jgi:heptosyltransferase III
MRLLFVKLRHIGDALLLTPTLAAVKQALPRAEIWVVVRRGTEGILKGCPHIDHVRTAMIPEHGDARDAHRGGDLALLRELRTMRFEHAFEMGGGDRGRWLVTLCGARGRTTNTAARRFPKFWKLAFNRPATTRRYGFHEVQRDYITVADVLPLPRKIPPLRFEPAAVEGWEPADGMGDFAVLHAGTRRGQKAWVEERWIETGRALLARIPRLVLSCGPDPAERDLASRLRNALGNAAVSTDGRTTWSQLAGLLHRARLFVGVDTAAMHLAAACGCPTVALFGGSKLFEWYPWRVRHRVVRARDWLGAETATLSPADLMREITTDRVVAACDEVIAGGGVVLPSESRLVIAMEELEGQGAQHRSAPAKRL